MNNHALATPARFGSAAIIILAALTLTGYAQDNRGPKNPKVAARGRGVVTGTVRNSATGNLLTGATVEIRELHLSTFTDSAARFLFADVPPGAYHIAVTYTGLDEGATELAVSAGETTTHNFDLSAEVYRLAELRVTGEREGSAASITAQRNASNVKNVAATDSFGNLPNMSVGELAIRLPGVASMIDDEGNVTGINVRGMGPTLNQLNVDGSIMPPNTSMGRQFQTQMLSGALFDEVEVTKGHTPDQSADSLGGTINLKTPSPLNMSEKRRFNYNLSARWAPPFTDPIKMRRDHPLHPLLNTSYEEVFDLFGGRRNLGVSLSAFYTENVGPVFRTIRDFQNTTAQPAYLWDYRTFDSFNNRKQTATDLKVEYQHSLSSKFTLNLLDNDSFEPFYRAYEARAFTAQTIATLGPDGKPTGTGTILPGFTDQITQVRGLPASDMQITETRISIRVRMRGLDFGGQHDFDRFHLDYKASYRSSHANLGTGGGGTLSLDDTGVGWTLDRTKSDLYPTFTQTEGPDIRNIASYKVGQLVTRSSKRNSSVADFTGKIRYEVPVAFPLSLQAGLEQRTQTAAVIAYDHRWNYVSNTPLPVDPSIVAWDYEKTGRVLPYFETGALVNDNYQFANPSLWSEDRYYKTSQGFIGTNNAREEVTSAYGMFKGKLWHLGLLAGVRGERTEVSSFAYLKAATLSNATQQANDPVGSALADYNHPGTAHSSYTKMFPSAHLTFDATKSVKARLSWSESFGRPAFGTLIPGQTINVPGQVVTVNNPGLKPQLAENWDAALEYYFEPVGLLSLGWFHKSISDFIVSNINHGTVANGPDNGFNGQYSGYTLLSAANAGSAFTQGLELSYQQQFTFLPGALKGLGASLNATYMRAHGKFAGSTYVVTSQVPQFIPQSGNASLTWRYRAFNLRVRANYQGRYINSFTAANSPRNQYRFARTVTDLDLGYRLNRAVSIYCTVGNILGARQEFYRYVTSQMAQININPATITFSVQGRF